MPKRVSSKIKTPGLGRDLHWHSSDDPLLKFAFGSDVASEAEQPSHAGRNLRNSQAEAVKKLGRSLGYAEQEIEAAVAAPDGEPKYSHRILEDEIRPIVDAVGLPLKTSKRELSQDLGLAESLFWASEDAKAFRKTKEALSSIETAARRLKFLLSNEVAWRSLTPRLLQAGSVDLSFSRSSLKELIRAAGESQNLSTKPSALPSASDMIIARLCEAFERHFGAVTTSRPGDPKKQTPYLRFVKIALQKIRLPAYDVETVIRATSKWRKAKQARAA
jgi:hypothetical protein